MSEMRGIPTEDDLLRLPRYAAVAYAARCARRVQPLYLLDWLKVPSIHTKAVEQAITYAETGVYAGAYVAASICRKVADAADATMAMVGSWGICSNSAANAAASAARAASYAAYANTSGDEAYVASSASADLDAASDAAKAAFFAASALSTYLGDKAPTASIGEDFESIRRLTAARRADDKPVPPVVFGPLWPDGPPPGWPTEDGTPESSKQPSAPVLTIIWDPKVVSAADYADLIRALGDVVRAEGGVGIERLRSMGYGTRVTEGVTV